MFLRARSSTCIRTSTRHLSIHSRRRLGSSTSGFSTVQCRKSEESANKSQWTGRQTQEHVANRDDNLNPQAKASKEGRNDQAQGGTSRATAAADLGKDNKRAEEEHPEAPKPVIGMNDERGRAGH